MFLTRKKGFLHLSMISNHSYILSKMLLEIIPYPSNLFLKLLQY